MTRKPFNKFIKQEEKGARKKERIRQEKRVVRAASRAFFEQKKAEGRQSALPVNSTADKKTARQPLRVEKQKQATSNKTAGRPAKATPPSSPARMPLNKYIAHCGICARREAADWVKSGKVTVNNNRILEPGYKVSPHDEVKVNGKPVHLRRQLVYILLNKPKDCITTTSDPRERKTVLDLVKQATTERVYPIGRLDRNTTGVLLLTNDGELAQKLSHPRYEVKKVYEVTLNKPLTGSDFDNIVRGIVLDDGFIAPDALAWPVPGNKQVVGIEIHSGRNRIVRRIFEHLGYEIKALDRVLYANLSKKNVERGKWRYLNEKEVRLLKFLNASYKK